MYYNPIHRNRKLKSKLFSFLRTATFQILHLSAAYRIVMIGILIMIGALCVPWILYQGGKFSAFHGVCGRIGYVIFFGIICLIIILIS
jgi:hypothetical protein